MTSTLLAAVVGIYILGLLLVRKQRFGLLGYVWGAFGFAAILILIGQHGNWNRHVGSLQASVLMGVGNWLGLGLTALETATIIVPDPSGWSVLHIGIECSTLIEASVFAGLILYYPRFPSRERLIRFAAGLGATFLLNLARLSVIIGMVMWLGKPAVPWAHAIVGRLVFFFGIVAIYWRMLTMPTLHLIKRDLEVSGRAIS